MVIEFRITPWKSKRLYCALFLNKHPFPTELKHTPNTHTYTQTHSSLQFSHSAWHSRRSKLQISRAANSDEAITLLKLGNLYIMYILCMYTQKTCTVMLYHTDQRYWALTTCHNTKHHFWSLFSTYIQWDTWKHINTYTMSLSQTHTHTHTFTCMCSWAGIHLSTPQQINWHQTPVSTGLDM